MLLRENSEFLDSLERYFTYFRTRVKEKLQPQKGIFKSPNVVRSKNIFVTHCTVHTNTTELRF
jgi:hypothetical protein